MPRVRQAHCSAGMMVAPTAFRRVPAPDRVDTRLDERNLGAGAEARSQPSVGDACSQKARSSAGLACQRCIAMWWRYIASGVSSTPAARGQEDPGGDPGRAAELALRLEHERAGPRVVRGDGRGQPGAAAAADDHVVVHGHRVPVAPPSTARTAVVQTPLHGGVLAPRRARDDARCGEG